MVCEQKEHDRIDDALHCEGLHKTINYDPVWENQA